MLTHLSLKISFKVWLPMHLLEWRRANGKEVIHTQSSVHVTMWKLQVRVEEWKTEQGWEKERDWGRLNPQLLPQRRRNNKTTHTEILFYFFPYFCSLLSIYFEFNLPLLFQFGRLKLLYWIWELSCFLIINWCFKYL